MVVVVILVMLLWLEGREEKRGGAEVVGKIYVCSSTLEQGREIIGRGGVTHINLGLEPFRSGVADVCSFVA